MRNAGQHRGFQGMSWLIALIFALSVGAGCADDTPPPNKVPDSGDVGVGVDTDVAVGEDTRTDVGGGATDSGDVTPGICDEVYCESGEICVEGVCEELPAVGFSCEAPHDLGTLVGGTPLEAKGNSDGQPVLLETGCAVQHNSSQSVFTFRVAADTEVSVKLLETTQPVVMELREDGCVDGSSALFCGLQPESFQAKAGKDYYLVVEARHDFVTGDFTVELTAAAPQVCSPAGSWSCDGSERVQCFAGTEERKFACGSSCSEGVCEGDVCENAIVVDGAVTVAGTTRAYENRFDFTGQPSCSTGGITGPVTVGQDVVFSLPGLKAGQTVSVDTTNQPGGAVIGLTRSCGVSAGCVAADSTTGKLVWSVDAAGDYFVVIDRRVNTDIPFEYTVEVLD